MASTASFIHHRDVVRNSACFASIRVQGDEPSYVIIEEEKFIFDLDTIYAFLDDLKAMKFDITYKYQERKKRILIDVSKIAAQSKRMAFFTMVRFLWEGGYNASSFNGDNFTQCVRHHNKIKELLPKEKNMLMVMCLATNAFQKGNDGYNANHFLTSHTSCKLLRKLSAMKDEYGVHSEFEGGFNLDYDEDLEDADMWDEQDYFELFKEVNYKK